jgi:hypothetical protein
MAIFNLFDRRLMKFTEESDPIMDLGIGCINLINKWIKEWSGIIIWDKKGSEKIEFDGKYWKINGHLFLFKNENNLKEFMDKGCGIKVTGNFFCNNLGLTSLKNCPVKIVDGTFSCVDNNLESLEGCPDVKGNFWCDKNKLPTLDECPREVHGSFSCTNNSLENLDALPEKENVEGNIWI